MAILWGALGFFLGVGWMLTPTLAQRRLIASLRCLTNEQRKTLAWYEEREIIMRDGEANDAECSRTLLI